MFNLAQGAKFCTGIVPVEAGAAFNVNGEGIDLRNAHQVYVVVELDQAGADQITATLQQSEGTNWEAMTETVPVWVCLDTAADDVLVRQADAFAYQTTADIASKLVIFQVDPARLDDENGTSGDPNYALRIVLTGGALGDSASAFYLVSPTRYMAASVPEIRL